MLSDAINAELKVPDMHVPRYVQRVPRKTRKAENSLRPLFNITVDIDEKSATSTGSKMNILLLDLHESIIEEGKWKILNLLRI